MLRWPSRALIAGSQPCDTGAVSPSREPTYALQTVTPFWKVFRDYPQLPKEFQGNLDEMPADVRIPVAGAQEILRVAVELTGEPDLGLIAAQATELGSFSVLEYAAASAPTWRDSLQTVFRYSRIMNEAADFRLQIEDGRAYVILHSTVPLVRAGVDYQSAAMHVSATRWLQPMPDELEVWFRHDRPENTAAYEATFSTDHLVFNAPFDGFVFNEDRLDTKLPHADPSLHYVLHQHAQQLLARLAPGDALVEQVRAYVLSTLSSRAATATETASKFHMARRTLTRRLQQEGTTFSALLDDVRRQAAIHYVESTEHTVEDVAFLLGFSEPSPFVRAFKRWTGQTPIAYRKSARQSR